MSDSVNRKFNFCELKLDHGDFIDRIDHKMKFLLIADRSIDERLSDRRLGHDCATLALAISVILFDDHRVRSNLIKWT